MGGAAAFRAAARREGRRGQPVAHEVRKHKAGSGEIPERAA